MWTQPWLWLRILPARWPDRLAGGVSIPAASGSSASEAPVRKGKGGSTGWPLPRFLQLTLNRFTFKFWKLF